MTKTLEIIKDEQMPAAGGTYNGRWVNVTRHMQIGDSLRVPKFAHAQGVRNSINNIEKGVSKAAVRKRHTDEGGVYWQVWRIA